MSDEIFDDKGKAKIRDLPERDYIHYLYKRYYPRVYRDRIENWKLKNEKSGLSPEEKEQMSSDELKEVFSNKRSVSKTKEDIKEEIEITSGNITATLFNRKVAPVWILTDGDNPGWELIFNPFVVPNKSFVLDEMNRKGFKGDGRKGDNSNIAKFIKTKEFGRTVVREYKRRNKNG